MLKTWCIMWTVLTAVIDIIKSNMIYMMVDFNCKPESFCPTYGGGGGVVPLYLIFDF